MFTLFDPLILTHSNQGECSKEEADGTGWRQPPTHHHPETWFRCETYKDTNFLGRVFVDDGWPPPAVPPVPEQRPQRDQDTFLATVISLLPDICPDYAQQQGHACGWDSELFLNRILEEEGNGTKYPRRVKKRKRDDTDVGDNAKESKLQKLHKKYEGRVSQYHRDHHYSRVCRLLLKEAFPKAYVGEIEEAMLTHNSSVYQTYSALHEDFSKPDGVTFRRKLYPRHKNNIVEVAIDKEDSTLPGREAQQEFLAAQEVCSAKLAKDAAKEAQEREDKENFENAKAEGAITECGCCFDELPYNRMVHCDGDTAHWFCYDCARRQAENQIGQQRYHLGCMSMDGCEATFSRDQKDLFLDDRLKRTLDQIEQSDSIRRAGIEGLETCPFCNYAAEYPPVEVNWEFECQQPECGVKSCRRCRQETHIGKSCDEAMAEAARNKSEDAKRKLEEARSLAMIRECYKCKNRFIKESGCNKMTCPRCRAMQCYVCRQPCDYNHFDDLNRGGRKGNCPLFEQQSLDDIHDKEAREAEERERKKLLEADPSMDAKELEIKFDEKLFPKRQQHAHPNGVHVAVAYPGQGPARLRHALAGIVAQPQVGGPNQAQPGMPGAAHVHVQPVEGEADLLQQYVRLGLPPGPVQDRVMEGWGRRYAQLAAQRNRGPVQPPQGQVANGYPNQGMNPGRAGYAALGIHPNPHANPAPNPAPNPGQAPQAFPGFGNEVLHHNHNDPHYMLNAHFPANVPQWNPGGPGLPGLALGPLPPNDEFGLPQMAQLAAPRLAAHPPPVAANNIPNPVVNARSLGRAPVVAVPPRQQVPVVDLTADE
ncbi:hypothetical protein B0T13DRAFT_394231 [Neurospora crassa]|nr:hypothetical protein B0T13DRAFT_394231 [Neurospora crassa]